MNQSKRQEIRACTFEMEIIEGTGNIKFPCSCFVEWKTSNGKDIIKSPNPVKLIQRKLAFKERLTLTTPLIYDLSRMTYLKKQSIIILNLLSNSRPNEPKLVGRITIELSSVANGTHFNQMAQYPLQFCSVEATLTFRVVLKDYAQTNLALSDLDRSQYSELEQNGGERQAAKEDTKSESGAKSISSANISEGVANRLIKEQALQKSSESCFQDRINRIKAQNQHLYKVKPPEGYSSRLKREMEGGNANLKVSVRQQRFNQSANQQRLLSNDLSVPILTKNTDAFDSNKVSERTISHPNKSEKQIMLKDSKISDHLLKDSNESLQQQFHSIKNDMESKKQVESNSNSNKYQSEISELRQTISHLKAQNNSIFRQLQQKQSEMDALIINNTQTKDSLAKLSQQLAIKTKQLEEIQALNYPALIQQLNRTIQEKDNEIQSLIQSTFQAEKNLQDKQKSLQQQIRQLKGHISQLEESSLLSLKQKQSKSQQTSPIKSQKNSPIKQQKTSYAQMQQLKQKIEDLTYNLGIERKNNQNSKLELFQVQQWYKEMQEQAERLSVEKEELRKLLQDQRLNSAALQSKIDHLIDSNQSSAAVSSQMSDKQQVIKSLTNHLNEVTKELDGRKATIEQLQYNCSKLQQQLQSTKKELDDIQSKYVEQQQRLAESMEKITQLANQIDRYKAQALSSASSLQRKGQQLEDAQRKLADLIKRMKEKQENLLKSQRQAEQIESKLKITQGNCDKIKQRNKTLEGEKTADQQKIKSLEKQIRLLRNKAERDQQSLNKQISKLKQSLQNENSKKKELTNMLSQVENKSKSNQNSKIKELQKKINKYVEKQNLFKQQLFILDEQSNKISQILQEKQDNQDKFTQSLTILNQENTILRAKISELENQCELLNERNQGLEAEIELLNAYQPNDHDSNEIGELNKKLIEKNKELLHQIEEKNLLIAEYEKTEGEMRGKQVQQLVSSSRIQKERQEYEQKYQEVVDQNEKLYKEFEKLNIKYKQQLSEASQASQVKIQALQSKIEQFFGKLTEKDVKYAELEMKSKEDLQKLEQNLHEKQYQVQYYSTQVKELTSNIETLNEQVGQKEFQLHLAEQKIKQLFENINNLSLKQAELAPTATPQPIIQRNQELQQELSHYKSRIQFYEAQIERFHEKEFVQEKELITLNEELTKLRQNGEEEAKHISYLEGQLKNCRERESKYIEQIDKLSANENLFKSRYVRLQKDKNQLISEIDKLTGEVESLKQKLGDKSREGTPINKFRESPSPLKAPAVDISDIVGQINSILTRRKQEEDLESALRLVIDNNARQEQQFERWSRQRGLIQQKAKMASKQLQKIKSNIMKTANKSIAQKTQLTNLLKPAEAVVNQLINISENLIQLDPYEEQEEQFEGQDTTN